MYIQIYIYICILSTYIRIHLYLLNPKERKSGHDAKAAARLLARQVWLSHDIAVANIVWCMAYKRGVGERSCIAHKSCNS